MEQLIKNVLAELGYNSVALPRSDIQPLELLSRENGHLSPLNSPLELLFEADAAPLPLPAPGTPDIIGRKTFEFGLKAGFSFLDGLFRKIGLDGSKLQAQADGGHSYKVAFSFEEIAEEKVGLLDLDNFLTGAIPREKEFRTYMERLKKSELYVITSVLASSTFFLKIEDANGRSLDLETTLQGAAEAKVAVNRSKNNGFSIFREEGPPLVFAFKAVQILYDKARWFEFWKAGEARFRIKNQEGLTLKGISDFPVRLLEPDAFIVEI